MALRRPVPLSALNSLNDKISHSLNGTVLALLWHDFTPPVLRSVATFVDEKNLMTTQCQILVVDDEEQILELPQRYFGKRGYPVAKATSSTEALERIKECSPAVAALDIWLGDESGLDLLATLKGQYPELPVIILTGSGYDEELFQQARGLGADGFVSKGLPLAHLVMEILRVSKYRNRSALQLSSE